MRYIKFRGKDILSGDLVYGDLIHEVGSKNGRMYILPTVVNLAYVKNCHPLDGVEVDPETVGQFTGLFDNTKWDQLSEKEKNDFLSKTNELTNTKNTKDDWKGREIFEGDVLFGREEGDDETTAWTNFYYVIFYDEKLCSFMAKDKDDTYWDIVICEINEQYKVIGNIFDNPEYLNI